MQMLIFFFVTMLFIFGQGGFMFFFFKMTAVNGMLDILFKWQTMLDKLYGSKYIAFQLLGKALGNCDLCSCFWWSLPSFFMLKYISCALDVWPFSGIISTIIWLWVFWTLSAYFSYYFVTKSRENGL